jgi:hypothetical protein
VKGTPKSGKMRLVESRKTAKEKMKCDPLKDAVEGDWGAREFGGG